MCAPPFRRGVSADCELKFLRLSIPSERTSARTENNSSLQNVYVIVNAQFLDVCVDLVDAVGRIRESLDAKQSRESSTSHASLRCESLGSQF